MDFAGKFLANGIWGTLFGFSSSGSYKSRKSGMFSLNFSLCVAWVLVSHVLLIGCMNAGDSCPDTTWSVSRNVLAGVFNSNLIQQQAALLFAAINYQSFAKSAVIYASMVGVTFGEVYIVYLVVSAVVRFLIRKIVSLVKFVFVTAFTLVAGSYGAVSLLNYREGILSSLGIPANSAIAGYVEQLSTQYLPMVNGTSASLAAQFDGIKRLVGCDADVVDPRVRAACTGDLKSLVESASSFGNWTDLTNQVDGLLSSLNATATSEGVSGLVLVDVSKQVLGRVWGGVQMAIEGWLNKEAPSPVTQSVQ